LSVSFVRFSCATGSGDDLDDQGCRVTDDSAAEAGATVVARDTASLYHQPHDDSATGGYVLSACVRQL
jgi:hypothetical protein